MQRTSETIRALYEFPEFLSSLPLCSTPAVRPPGRTFLSSNGPCLSPSIRLRTGSASWSALPYLASIPSDEAGPGVNGFGSFCRINNSRALQDAPYKDLGCRTNPGPTENRLGTKVGNTNALRSTLQQLVPEKKTRWIPNKKCWE